MNDFATCCHSKIMPIIVEQPNKNAENAEIIDCDVWPRFYMISVQ